MRPPLLFGVHVDDAIEALTLRIQKVRECHPFRGGAPQRQPAFLQTTFNSMLPIGDECFLVVGKPAR